jgi:ATP-dependent DNA helicase RecG
MAHFQGTTKTIGFFDERRYVGHAFNILREAETFARRHLNIAMKFNPNDLQREDIPQLPFLAIREALINAICHRDYIHNAGSISLAIFDDRLEIWNMGELPTPLQPNDLKIQHVSIPRNEKIAHAFYVRQYIEKWGSGTTRMMELCKELGVPEPEYSQYSGGFCVTFKFSEILDVPQPKELLPIHVTARQTRILDLLSEKARPLSLNEIAELMPNVHVRLIRNDLYALKKGGKTKTSGHARAAVWSLT